ncbi:MAG: tetratricopeptide repeat protein [Polyangiales bacterium]
MTDPSLRRAIDAVREHDAPGDVDREALLKKILASAPTPAPAATKTLPLLGVGVVVTVVALLGALAWRSAKPPAARLTTPRIETSAPQRALHASQSTPSAPQTGPAAPQTGPIAPGSTITAPQTGPTAPQSTPTAPQSTPTALSAHPWPIQEAPGGAQGAHVGPRRVAAPTAEADEWRILREADAALGAHEPERALVILGQHTAQHPHGVAGPEVLAYRVRAYCMAGRVDEARAVADELRARAPVSPAAYSLRATCVSDR